MKSHVILVDKNDRFVGEMEKIEAHEKALLHRAVSVFVINSNNDWLLQQRAAHKYHSANLWTNTACTHPMPGESCPEAVHRRLREEMGLEANIYKLFTFMYKETLENGLTEHELDHVYVGYTDELPDINPEEVQSYAYKSFEHVHADVQQNPDQYTVWFKKIYERVQSYITSSETPEQ